MIGVNFSKDKEKIINGLRDSAIELAVKHNKNLIISDTNLKTSKRELLEQQLISLGYNVEIKEFEIDLQEAYKRDANRAGGVGRDVIYSMYQKWLKYKCTYTYIPDEDKPKAIIFDIDGTLSNSEGIRNIYALEKVGEDDVHQEILDMLLGYEYLGYNIIILSGRDDSCLEATTEWLHSNSIYADEILMRVTGDKRKDYTIKKELFDKVAGWYNIRAVVDDRPQVCRMWRDIGLKVIQVGDPYVEF